jgi:hypothetical protein
MSVTGAGVETKFIALRGMLTNFAAMNRRTNNTFLFCPTVHRGQLSLLALVILDVDGCYIVTTVTMRTRLLLTYLFNFRKINDVEQLASPSTK